MADYQILKITVNNGLQNETTYFKQEVVGHLGFGGDQEPPYPQDKIINLHAYYVKKKGNTSTRFDRAAAQAKTIDVQILHKDDLRNATVTDVNKVKKELIEKFAKDHPLDWRERLLNEYLLPRK